MPWHTPTLRDVRGLVRDSIRARLPGADATIPNSVLRVISDSQGALCHLTLQYVDWLALQLLPDTAETEFLDRHGDIWLVNADGTTGRKMATLSRGSVTFTGVRNTVLPAFSRLTGGGTTIEYETMEQIIIGTGDTPAPIRALMPGAAGNLAIGTQLALEAAPSGVDQAAIVALLAGGTDDETDDELRMRILERIRKPPMGGDQDDYILWSLSFPGVTRAWSFPQEMGIGTCTVRFMMDDLRAANGGFPLPDDVVALHKYLDTVRPVTVKDLFVECPIPVPINVRITYLSADVRDVHNAIIESLKEEFFFRSKPGQTWYRAWTDEGIMNAPGVIAYDLVGEDQVMPSNGYMPILGDVTYG